MGEAGKNHIYSGLIIAMIVSLCAQGLYGIYGFSLFPDEFGYWVPAATQVGYDWTQTVAVGSYYSFGYSILLMPIMLLFRDSTVAYRVAVCLNLCLQAGGFVLLCGIAKRLFGEISNRSRIFLCGFTALYPAWTFYTQMTMAEGLLFFLYILSAWMLIRYLEKPHIWTAVIFAFVLCYMYTVHMRAIGMLLAGVVTVAVSAVKNSENKLHFAAFCAVAVLLFLMSLYLKDRMISQVYTYAQPAAINVNDYAGQTGKLVGIFSPWGILGFLSSMVGKLLYLGCATFGTAFIGIVVLARKAYTWLREGESNALGKHNAVYLFLLLSVVFQFCIMNVYLIGSADADNTRLDLFLHGRYFDFVVPLQMMTGICDLLSKAGTVRKLAVTGLLMMVLAACSTVIIAGNRNGMDDPRGEMMIGMSYFLHGEGAQPVWYPFFCVAASLICAAFIYTLAHAYRKTGADTLLLIPVALHILLGLHACSHFIYEGQANSYGDIQIADKVAELQEENGGRIVHLYEGGRQYVDNVQFRLREKGVTVFPIREEAQDLSMLDADDYVLVNFESDLKEELGALYSIRLEAGHFDLYYNTN